MNELIKKVQLIVHPRRLPYPLRPEPSDSVKTSEEGQNDIMKVQHILPFPELPVVQKSQDVPITFKPASKPDITPLQLHSTIPEESNAGDLDKYMTELDAKMQMARNVTNAMPSIDSIIPESEKDDVEAMPTIVDVPSD